MTDAGSVGVGIVSPQEKLDVSGAIKINTTTNPSPQAGTVRWNPNLSDFEGFTGVEWKSFTQQNKWGLVYATENQGYVPLSGVLDIEHFGINVDAYGDKAIVGADMTDGLGTTDEGSVHFFERIGTTWSLGQSLNASDGASDDRFGNNVSIYGDWAIVGAQDKDVGLNSAQGKAYIYHYNGSFWTEHTILTASDAADSDHFGSDVSISGAWVIVGAQHKDVGLNGSQGKAYLFKYNGTTWIEKQILTASDGIVNGQFGLNVSIKDDYVIIGAQGQVQAYIWYRQSGDTWIEQDILAPSDGVPGDWFGQSVAIADPWAIVGTPNKEVNNNDSQGQIYAFKRNGSSWVESAILTGSDGAEQDGFGREVDITGSHLVVGAWLKDVGIFTSQGQAYVFNVSGDLWNEEAIIAASDKEIYSRFGHGVAISGNWVIVGAMEKDYNAITNIGKVYFYSK